MKTLFRQFVESSEADPGILKALSLVLRQSLERATSRVVHLQAELDTAMAVERHAHDQLAAVASQQEQASVASFAPVKAALAASSVPDVDLGSTVGEQHSNANGFPMVYDKPLSAEAKIDDEALIETQDTSNV